MADTIQIALHQTYGGGSTISRTRRPANTLGQIAEAVRVALREAGYPYVADVTLSTDSGTTYSATARQRDVAEMQQS